MSFIKKAFGGLDTSYYFRHLFFGILFGIFAASVQPELPFYILSAIMTLLYPYSRFVYENVVGFIMGNNVFILPLGFGLIWKFTTMFLCFVFSFFIAPIGLLFLYFYHTKHKTFDVEENNAE